MVVAITLRPDTIDPSATDPIKPVDQPSTVKRNYNNTVAWDYIDVLSTGCSFGYDRQLAKMGHSTSWLTGPINPAGPIDPTYMYLASPIYAIGFSDHTLISKPY